MLKDREGAYHLLRVLKAPARLIHHGRFVADAAGSLLFKFRSLGVVCDDSVVELGSVLHDAGKILHPEELSGPGSLHEQAGLALLLEHGVPLKIAQCCASHGAWNLAGVSLEELTVALADKLWKGKREAALELLIIDEVARRLGVSRWDVFEELDTTFEEIAAGGAERVEGSKADR